MAYKRTNWIDGETKLNAANLNNIEDGLQQANSDISNVSKK